MTTRTRTSKLAALIVCGLCLGLTAGLLGIGLTPKAQATTTGHYTDPRIGNYEAAQRELDEHLQQRIQLHLARVALASRSN
ncbi:MAG: hypothetical protein ABIJ09_10040 [Pseudomonadota bacterium]